MVAQRVDDHIAALSYPDSFNVFYNSVFDNHHIILRYIF
jgi:hypothetical protein